MALKSLILFALCYITRFDFSVGSTYRISPGSEQLWW